MRNIISPTSKNNDLEMRICLNNDGAMKICVDTEKSQGLPLARLDSGTKFVANFAIYLEIWGGNLLAKSDAYSELFPAFRQILYNTIVIQ